MVKRNFSILLVLLLFTQSMAVNAYWASTLNSTSSISTVEVSIGEWVIIEIFDKDTDYEVGDTFSYDDSIWIVTGSWFREERFLRNDGTINFNYVRSWGPIQEDTNEWRDYNTYYINDVVTHNGDDWIVLHYGANNHEPGTDTNAWNKITNEWYLYNTYQEGDIVIYNNIEYIALEENRNRIPDSVS